MPRGYYQADLSAASDADKEIASRVCPFTHESKNEDVLGEERFPDLPHDSRTGRYRSTFAGRLAEDTELPSSSSGGLTTWLLLQLLEQGEVDGIIHVSGTESPMFGYTVSRTVNEVLDARKSKYHPATFSEALNSVRGDGLRYALVGVPCAIRSARLVAQEDPTLGSQLSFFVGIVCGHLKSSAYAESFAWQLGIAPDDLETVDFRIKDPSLTSRQYSFGAKSRSTGNWVERQTLSLVGGSWGHAVFQLDACNYCDDVFAETADVVIGDAWLPKYEIDWRGTNVIVTRDPTIDRIFRKGAERGELSYDELDTDATARTQAGNFRHRREGLAVRLADDEKAGRWTPRKRVAPGYDHVTPERVALIRKRRTLSTVSHEAFAAAKEARELKVYLDVIKPLINDYQNNTKMTFAVRVRNRLQREMWKALGRMRRS
jgi:coenzyme F420-reducing hydrogenase beta subunit